MKRNVVCSTSIMFQRTELEFLSPEAKEFTAKLVSKYDKTNFFKHLQPSEVAFRATWKGNRFLNKDKRMYSRRLFTDMDECHGTNSLPYMDLKWKLTKKQGTYPFVSVPQRNLY